MRYLLDGTRNEVLLSSGSDFAAESNWITADHGADGWYVGDFNGDGRSDLLRYVPGVSGAQVFLSNGSNFIYSGSWTGAGNGVDGWYLGDFNGDGKDDLMRYVPGVSGGEVFLSNGSIFVESGSWTGAGNDGNGWYLGKFSGTARTDIMRYVLLLSGADVLLSAVTSGVSMSATQSAAPEGKRSVRWLNDVPASKPLSAEELTLLEGIKARMAAGEEITIYQVQREYEMLTGKLLTRAGIMKLLKRQEWDDLYRHNGDDLLQ